MIGAVPTSQVARGVAGSALVLMSVGACAAPAGLSARMSDQEVREVVAREFPRGIDEGQVRTTLDDLGVSQRYRLLYPATEDRPAVLLVRLYRGGTWIDQEVDDLRWLDLSFLFDEAHRFDRVVLFRDRQNYFQGDPIGSPMRRPAGRTPSFPGAVPPPADPLEGAT